MDFNSMKRPEVCVIIPYLNEACGLADCLASLAGVRYPDFAVVMVHDGPGGTGPGRIRIRGFSLDTRVSWCIITKQMFHDRPRRPR